MSKDIIKYRIYLKDGRTTIDCIDIVEKDDKYIFSLPNGKRPPLCFELSFDDVDMIWHIGPKVFGCEIDSMALGLEPHKSEAMLRYIKRRFEGA